MVDRKSLRWPAGLLFVGLLLFVGITALHPGREDANDHPAVFAEYAASAEWDGIHLGQFAGMAVMISGLLGLVFAFNTRQSTPGFAGWLGAISAGGALALYGVLQAVDGVALERAVDAWASAPEAEKAARFASAEAIRWLEEGVRSYHDVMLGLALILLGIMISGAANARSADNKSRETSFKSRNAIFSFRPIGYLMGLSGAAYLVQGWVLSTQGFSPAHTLTIIIAEILTLLWILWLLAAAWRIKEPSGAPTG